MQHSGHYHRSAYCRCFRSSEINGDLSELMTKTRINKKENFLFVSVGGGQQDTYRMISTFDSCFHPHRNKTCRVANYLEREYMNVRVNHFLHERPSQCCKKRKPEKFTSNLNGILVTGRV